MTVTTIPPSYYIIAAVAVVVLVVVLMAVFRGSRSARLRKRFGPEYERLARERSSREEAERELAQRESRVKAYKIADLPEGARGRYNDEWRVVQAKFVDEPRVALQQADTLIANVMRDRNYPVVDFEQRAADLSADHARALQDYRAAHDIVVQSDNGSVSTEDLRQAMVHYRALFSELVGYDERKA